ncbi:hypothetical protein TNIN_397141 [Trichonephila inaurata madagascariensis]|uniref:Uncharacterized protein n=1 Tax=Trichonephila inaurata madagascariensis TaxID=2747483 RepID=A0A8X6X9Y1_9ARAC|nr:hypothetical protein TNIN_397141 [Trichonephila inaurata madagascariensis]
MEALPPTVTLRSCRSDEEAPLSPSMFEASLPCPVPVPLEIRNSVQCTSAETDLALDTLILDFDQLRARKLSLLKNLDLLPTTLLRLIYPTRKV